MKKSCIAFAAGLVLAWIPVGGTCCAQVVINEVMANVRGSETVYGDRNEYVELYNASSEPVDLSGWVISDGDAEDDIVLWSDSLGDPGPGLIRGSSVLASGRYCLVLDREYASAPDSEGYKPYHMASGALVLTTENSTIGNGLSTTDPVFLISPDGDTADTYGTPEESGDSLPFDPGDGISMERVFPRTPDEIANWTGSTAGEGCTPGSQNSVTPYVGVGLSWEDISLSPEVPAPGCDLRISSRIHNRSPEPAVGVSVLFFVDKGSDSSRELISEVSLPGIPKDGEGEASAVWERVPPGCHRMGVQVLDTVTAFRMVRAGSAPGEVVLNEVMFDPLEGGEWIEVYNRSSRPANLRHWVLCDTMSSCLVSRRDAYLAPGAFALICSDTLAFLLAFQPGGCLLLEPDGFPSLNNQGDSLSILDPSGFESDGLRYRETPGGGKGISLERVNPGVASAEEDNWGACVGRAGSTPGFENSIYAPCSVRGVRIELSPNPFSPDDDGREDRTVLSYSLPFPVARLNAIVYDRRGKLVRTITAGSMVAGSGAAVWDGRDESGRQLPIGVYLVLVDALDPLTQERFKAKKTVVLAGILR